MSDMTDEQRKAIRRALAKYPSLKVDISRSGNVASLTPYRIAAPEERGQPVNVTYGVTSSREVENQMFASCAALMEQS